MAKDRASQMEAAVRRLVDIDNRRIAVVVNTADDDLDVGVAATMPIMVEYHDVMAELRQLVGDPSQHQHQRALADALVAQADAYTVGWVIARAGMANCETALAELADAGAEIDDEFRRSFQAGFVAYRIETEAWPS